MAPVYQKADQYTATKPGTIAKVTNGDFENAPTEKINAIKPKSSDATPQYMYTPQERKQDGHYSMNEQPSRKKPKHNIVGEANGPMMHLGRDTGGITYKITNARNYICI